MRSISQTTVMAAIVATLFFPVGAALALLCCAVLGISVHSLATFGNTFNAVAGVLVWWAICFLPAFAYAALMLE